MSVSSGCRNLWVGPLAGVLFACGPSVQTADDESSATSGGSGNAESSSGVAGTSSSGEADGADSGSSSGNDAEAVCGNGIVDAEEDCDDGNMDNADGCSATCEISGAVRWIQPLPPGFGVGLSSRSGEVVAAVQQYGGDLVPLIAVERYDGLGNNTGTFVDPNALSDLDFARAPVELLPSGDVALAYPVFAREVQRDFAVLDFDAGIIGAFSAGEGRWGRRYGVATSGDSISVLHSVETEGVEELVLERFDDGASLIESTPLGLDPQTYRPFTRGGVLRRDFPLSAFLVTRDDGGLELWSLLFGGSDAYSASVGRAPGEVRASAFSEGGAMWIWTGSALIQTDEQDHLIESDARSFEGELLWADALGMVVGVEGAVVLYDSAGAERMTVALSSDAKLPSRASFVRPDDGGAGLFVLVDHGISPKVGGEGLPVALHYIVR